MMDKTQRKLMKVNNHRCMISIMLGTMNKFHMGTSKSGIHLMKHSIHQYKMTHMCCSNRVIQ